MKDNERNRVQVPEAAREDHRVVGHGLCGLQAHKQKCFRRDVTRGRQCDKSYSHTQDKVALSSEDSEFVNGIAKAATMSLGADGSSSDTGVDVQVQVSTDSSAAWSIANVLTCVRGACGYDKVAKGERSQSERLKARPTWRTHWRSTSTGSGWIMMHLKSAGIKKSVGRHVFCPCLGIHQQSYLDDSDHIGQSS